MLALLPLAASIALPLCGSCQEIGWGAEGVPVGVEGDAYADTDPSALTDFRGALDNHGAWVDDPSYGTTWVPEPAEVGPEFSPYVSAGHWSYQDDMVWVSDYEWGWVPFHYGRWVLIEGRGWAWIPGRAYAGAWVDWRTGDAAYGYGFVGWAPMAPEFGWRGGVAVTIGAASPAPAAYVASGNLFAPQVASHVAPPAQAAAIAAHTTPYVPASPAVGGRVPAHPVPHGPNPVALGFDPSRLAFRSIDRGVIRAQQLARPSTAVALGAQPARPHLVVVTPAALRPRAVPVRAFRPAPAMAAPRGRR